MVFAEVHNLTTGPRIFYTPTSKTIERHRSRLKIKLMLVLPPIIIHGKKVNSV